MTLRIGLCDSDPPGLGGPAAVSELPTGNRRTAEPLLASLDDPYAPPLLLFVADEPEIGKRFHYLGVEWEIVDYDNGWVARLIVG